MPSLSQAQRPLPANYARVENPAVPPASSIPSQSLEPNFPTNMRCPVPPTSYTPDSSRQFYRGGSIPQFRAFAPAPLSSNTNSGGTTVDNSVVESSSSSTTSTGLSILTAAVTTPVLNPGSYAFVTATMSKAFILLSLSVSNAARVRLYATAAAQLADAGRTDSTALNFETTQGVFSDVTLDSSPWSWVMSPAPNVSNGDFPQTTNCYVTVNNDAAVSAVFIVSLQYVKLV